MMHHARIAQRAFNTPLMVEPSKALAFLSGLGPRIAGQEITFHGPDLAGADVVHAALPARASLIGGGIAEGQRNNDTQPSPPKKFVSLGQGRHPQPKNIKWRRVLHFRL
jgi:hypothetical protein